MVYIHLSLQNGRDWPVVDRGGHCLRWSLAKHRQQSNADYKRREEIKKKNENYLYKKDIQIKIEKICLRLGEKHFL